MPGEILWPLLGGSLLVLLTADVFLTILHPRGRGGPIQRMESRMIWTAFRTAGRRLDDPARSRLLSFGGPVIVLLVLGAWLVVLVAAFALIYYPWIESFLVSPGQLRSRWVEALYYSGYTAVTLGTGDVIADHETLRLLAPIQAFGGFALLSASVTYLLSIYRELMAREQTAATIDGYHRIGALDELAGPKPGDAASRWAERIDRDLLHLLQAHHQYPVLHYFRPDDPGRSLPLQLGHLLRIRSAVREAGATAPPGTERETGVRSSVRSLADSVEGYVEEVEAEFLPAADGRRDLPEEADRVERAHYRLLHYLDYRTRPARSF